MRTYPANRADLIRLFILQEHGGVWIDANSILLEDMSWITNLPSNPYVINKFGSAPQAFVFFLQYNQEFKMHLVSDQNGGLTRAVPSVGYEFSFIAT